jgi:hypothetical protein
MQNEKGDQVIAQAIAALDRSVRLFREALPKFDWGKSCLDANAIGLLNEVPGEVVKALASLRSLAPAPADQGDAGRNAVIEECMRVVSQRRSDQLAQAETHRVAGRFAVAKQFEAAAQALLECFATVRTIKSAAPAETVGLEPRGCPTPGACSCPGAVHTGAETVGRGEGETR